MSIWGMKDGRWYLISRDQTNPCGEDDMSAPAVVTEHDAVMRERAAFKAAFRLWLQEPPQWEWQVDMVAEIRYPLPRVRSVAKSAPAPPSPRRAFYWSRD